MNYCKSILDSDLYKLTTSYAYMNKYPQAIGCFSFVDRNKTKITDEQFQQIKEGIENLKDLQLTTSEEKWCKEKIYFIPGYYFEWLKTFRFEPDKVKIWKDENSELHIDVTDLLYKVTLYEIPILEIVSEVLCKYTLPGGVNWEVAKKRVQEKITIARGSNFKFSEFGSRRRFSYDVQDLVCNILSKEGKDVCVGTSNLHFAMKYGMGISGTHPHEWFMFAGAQFGYKMANYLALQAWQEIYRGSLGIALSDTYTSGVFLKNFDTQMAKLFDGVRHDSGDPFLFTDQVICRYNELKIDPKTKTIIFSDGLDFDTAAKINGYCEGKIKCGFGIGTNLTNDVDGIPCNIVDKLVWCQMNSKQEKYWTVKLSDVPGKHLGPDKEVRICLETLGVE